MIGTQASNTAASSVSGSPDPAPSLRQLLELAASFGLATGLLEGAGLLLFQRINWRSWGPMVHVSTPILWISPFADLLLFLFVLGGFGLVARLRGRKISLPAVISGFLLLMVYDWLNLTGRLYYWSCLLLAIGAAIAFQRWFRGRTLAVAWSARAALPWLLSATALLFIVIEGGNWLRERQAVSRLPPAAAGAPNVVVIVVDTLRADHLSVYGYGRPTSPNIDRIAREGVLFENAVSASSWSLPSHASLLTGRYQFEHGVDGVQPMPWLGWGTSGMGGYPTLGEALEKLGYRTGAFSANRVYFTRSVGLGRGFVHFEEYFHSAADSFLRTAYGREISRTLLAQSPSNPFRWLLTRLGGACLFDRDTEGQGRHSTGRAIRKRAPVVNAEALDWIDRDLSRPFFVFLNYMDVHAPYGTPAGYAKAPWERAGSSEVDEYDAGVRYADDFVGRLLKGLEERGLGKRTLVIVTSDHGELLGEHGLSAHGSSLYWGVVHVPLVMWYPGHVPQGARISRPVTNTAIGSTVLELLGDGGKLRRQSLARLWTSQQASAAWPAPLSEVAKNGLNPQNRLAGKLVPTAAAGDMKSLITPGWQFIEHRVLGMQLYNLKADPGETHNLVYTEQGRTQLPQMETGLIHQMARPERTAKDALPLPSWMQGGHRIMNGLYRLPVEAGVTFKLELPAQAEGKGNFDSVLSVENKNGDTVETCRSPQDDRLPSPGLSDPTPDSFDDVCVSDAPTPGSQASFGLEVIPQTKQIYIRVSDWNGSAAGDPD